MGVECPPGQPCQEKAVWQSKWVPVGPSASASQSGFPDLDALPSGMAGGGADCNAGQWLKPEKRAKSAKRVSHSEFAIQLDRS